MRSSAMDCVLRTPRLIVRLPREGDAAAIAAYYRDDEPHLRRFTPPISAMLSAAFWETQIEVNRADFEAGVSCRTFIYELDDARVIGAANLSNIMRGHFQACYLGYNIAKTHEGRGLMFEALQALMRYAFDELELHRIMANYMPANLRSEKLLERLGFVVEGTAKDYLLINGRWEDHVMAALVNPDWQG